MEKETTTAGKSAIERVLNLEGFYCDPIEKLTEEKASELLEYLEMIRNFLCKAHTTEK
jgi:uncharacterized protein YutD